ncbi:hypothetical protein BDC45DRAFT_571231 [Circinella umbellata]|nr:hypothetical protein BDC45DRAFT_571231 [Circinella umbellata]
MSLWIKEANEINPFASLRLLKFSNMLLCCLYLGCSNQYHFSSTFTGLWYLTGLIGSTAGTLLGEAMSDRIYIRRTEKAKLIRNPVFLEMRLSPQ